MSSNNLAVKITADIVDLQTKFSVARAEYQALTSEVNKLAKASSKGLLDEAGKANLQQAAGDLLRARVNSQGLAAQLAEAGVGMGSLGRSAEVAHTGLSGVIKESRALFDELSSGRTKQSPGTIALLATRIYSMSPAAFGAVAGVGALAAGLGYLAARAVEASHALDQMHLSALTAGNDVSRAQFDRLVQQLSDLPGVSTSAGRSIVSALSGVPGMTFDSITAAARIAAEEMRRTGADADKVAEKFTKAFEPTRSAVDVAKEIGGLSQAQVNEAIAADRSQNIHAVQAEKLRLLATELDRGRIAVGEYTRSWGQTIVQSLSWLGMTQEGLTPQQAQSEILKDQAQAWGRNAQSIREATAALAAAPAQKPLVYDQGSVLDRMREKMEQIATVWDGTQSGLLAKQIAVANQSLAETQKNSKEWLAIEQEKSRLEVQYRKESGNEIIASARTQTAALGAETAIGAVQRLEKERDVWQQVLDGEKLTAAQRVEVQRSLNTTLRELNSARQAQQTAISRSDADTDLAISRLRIEAQKDELDLDIQAHKISADQKYNILKDLTNKEYQLSLEALQGELASLKDQPVEYEHVYNQIRTLREKLQLDLSKLDKERAVDAARQVKDQSTAWKGAVNEIESAEGTLVSNLLNRRRGLAQSLLQISSEMVTREIANDLRAFTTKQLLHNSEKALEQGGFLYHAAVESRKAAATAASQSAQTSATIAGNTARLTATTSANAAAHAQAAAAGGKTVMQDAAKAYSGTYASVAQIPYVGWILAPIAASGAFAAVAGYESLASLDVGTNYVPRDMVAQIHEGEAIVPKQYNPAAGGSPSAGTGGYSEEHNYHGDLHVNAFDASSVARMLRRPGMRDSVVSAAVRKFRRGAQ